MGVGASPVGQGGMIRDQGCFWDLGAVRARGAEDVRGRLNASVAPGVWDSTARRSHA